MHRTRPIRWLTRRRAFWTIATLLALWLAWQVYDIFTGKPQPSIDYASQFYELCSSAQGEGENAWPLLMEVLERVDEASKTLSEDPVATQYYTDGTMIPGMFSDLTCQRLTHPSLKPHYRALDDLRADGTLDQLGQLASMSRCVRPRVDGEPFNNAYIAANLPVLTKVRQLIRLQAGRMAVTASNGKWQDLADITNESLAVSRFVGYQPSLINHLVAVSCVDSVLGELRTTLVERPLDEASARSLLRIVEDRAKLPTAEFTMAGEHLLHLDQIQNLYTTSGRLPISSFGMLNPGTTLPGTAAPARSFKDTAADVAAIIIPGRATAERLDAEYTREVVEKVESRELRDPDASIARWTRPLPLHQVVIKSMTLNPQLVAFGWRRHQHHIESTRLMLAIEIYIASEGRAPTSLDDLAPDILPEVPLDPLNGQTWGYCRLSQTSDGTSYLLWSFGEDGVDNNCYEGDEKTGRYGEPGTDRWINKPRYIPEGLKR
ncbi:MAG: hypothetical protein IT430_17945 [Phycisphaerales bacterium]|nr:hypothetical protein [Phycisphaerales bacterium]